MDLLRLMAAAACTALLGGCALFTHTNVPLERAAPAKPDAPRPRASFDIDGSRGNPRVLMFLALSGGGSRAAHLSAATMLRLQTLFDDIDLLGEVDVVSAVSGGSMTAALYAASRDTSVHSVALAAALPPALAGTSLARHIQVDAQGGHVRCSAALKPEELARLGSQLPALSGELRRLDMLCRQTALTHLKPWEPASVLDLTSRNYLMRWFGSWFRPANIASYWFTAFDRADIMAETLSSNLYGTRLLGPDLSMDELNPTRPFLFINATTAAEQDAPGLAAAEEYSFGSVFTFTEQDFRERIHSDIGRYSLARAVMASSSFPLVFPSQTLQDFRPNALKTYCETDAEGERHCTDRQYLHVFDGGNSDNLGLKSIKRALFQMEVEGRLDYDRIIVLVVDAFTRPHGASRLDPDPRGTVGMLLDINVSDAVDSLLLNNRVKLLGEFDSARLRWTDGDCKTESRELPAPLCKALAERSEPDLDLSRRLVFYHFGFDDVLAFDPKNAELKRRLDRIPTSFKILPAHAALVEQAVGAVIHPENPCLQQIRSLLVAQRGSPEAVALARTVCQRAEGLRR